jgi:lyso-ornithine lipid O-acyltransferase
MIAAVRGLRLVIHLLVALVLATIIRLDFTRRLSGERAMHWWCGVLVDLLNIRLVVRGEPHDGARLTVANHVSWLDMILIGACEPTRFISKSEVREWPLVGGLTEAAGTFYIRRGRGGAAPLLERLIPHLAGGGAVTLFPEGTTTDGRRVKTFHPRLFAAAIDARCRVQPVALRYAPDENGVDVAPFIGDDDLFSHILRVLRTPALEAELHYGSAFSAAGETREALARRAQQEIERAIGAKPIAATGAAPVLAA